MTEKTTKLGRKVVPTAKRRKLINATVHPNTAAFLKVCDEVIGLNRGRLIDKLISEKYPSVKID